MSDRSPRDGPRRALALVPVAALFVLGGSGRLAVLVFLGFSLLVAGMRRDPGCEVTTIPGLFRRRSGHLPRFLLSPVDSLERRLRANDGGDRS